MVIFNSYVKLPEGNNPILNNMEWYTHNVLKQGSRVSNPRLILKSSSSQRKHMILIESARLKSAYQYE